jgi:hypothetical protein
MLQQVGRVVCFSLVYTLAPGHGDAAICMQGSAL